MKKLLALGLSLAMMASLTSVAFAANPITKDTEQTGEAVVKTEMTDEDLEKYQEYTITFDAETTIDWLDYGSYTIDCDVTGRLLDGSTLTVTAAKTTDMTNDAGKTIAYTLTPNEFEATAITSTDIDMTTPVSRAVSVAVNAGEFEKQGLDVGVYSGTVTFTASFVDAAV